MSNEIVEFSAGGVFAPANFEMSQRIAKALVASTMVPKDYQNNIGNCLIALDMSIRTGFSPLMVMQNLHVIHGRPSWSGAFVAAAIRSCGRFDGVKLVMSDDKKSCHMEAREIASNQILVGPTVSIDMAKAEGWYDKPGSKWKTMPELMLQYRASSFFGRLHAAEVIMGMHTVEEVQDDPKRFDIELPAEKPVDPLVAMAEAGNQSEAKEKPKIFGVAHNELPQEVIDLVMEMVEAEKQTTTPEKIQDYFRTKHSNQAGQIVVPTKSSLERNFRAIVDGVKC